LSDSFFSSLLSLLSSSAPMSSSGKSTIAILGGGTVGGVLGKIYGKLGHKIIYGSRDPHAAKLQELVKETPNGSAALHADAIKAANLILLTTPWDGTESLCKSIADVTADKIVVDATNPIGPHLSNAIASSADSGGEIIQRLLPKAKVVKAFNTIGAVHYDNANFGGVQADMFMAGNDAEAKKIVGAFIAESGFVPVDVGDLTHSRYTEAMAFLWISIAFKQGWKSNHAFKLLRK